MCQHVLMNVVGENKCMCMCADRASSVYSGVITICRLLNVGSCVSLTQEPWCAVSRRALSLGIGTYRISTQPPFKWSRKAPTRRHTHTHTHTHTRTHIHAHTCTRARICIHTYKHAHVHTHISTHTHSYKVSKSFDISRSYMSIFPSIRKKFRK